MPLVVVAIVAMIRFELSALEKEQLVSASAWYHFAYSCLRTPLHPFVHVGLAILTPSLLSVFSLSLYPCMLLCLIHSSTFSPSTAHGKRETKRVPVFCLRSDIAALLFFR